jgi:hypothetical protein
MANRSRCWFRAIVKNGKIQRQYQHRRKGPAFFVEGSEPIWFLNDVLFTKEIVNGDQYFFAQDRPSSDKKLSSFDLIPSAVYKNGTKEWHFYGRLHRSDDLPAIEYSNGDKEWWYNGLRHRENGPSVILGNKHYWFKKGMFVKCITHQGRKNVE